jgi:hypothetical protein
MLKSGRTKCHSLETGGGTNSAELLEIPANIARKAVLLGGRPGVLE